VSDVRRIKALHDLERVFVLDEQIASSLVSQLELPPDVVRRFGRGLTIESRFPTTYGHLPLVALIHGLDQTQYPASSDIALQVPDYLVLHKRLARPSTLSPMLVETKRASSSGRNLNVSADRAVATEAYAANLGLQVVYATFWDSIGTWTLNALDQFQPKPRSFRINVIDALRNDLSFLLGDLLIIFDPPILRRTTYDSAGPDSCHIRDSRWGHLLADELHYQGAIYSDISEVESGLLMSVLKERVVTTESVGTCTIVTSVTERATKLKVSTLLFRLQTWFDALDSFEHSMIAFNTVLRFLVRIGVSKMSVVPEVVTPTLNALLKLSLDVEIGPP
jgi:hypothetical protein